MKKAETTGDQRTFSGQTEPFHRVKVEIKKISYPMEKDFGETGVLKDLAEGGISFIALKNYEPAMLLELRIHLAGWQRFKKSYSRLFDDSVAVAPLTAVGEVVWCEELSGGGAYATGVVFRDIYEDDYQAMRRYLEQIR